MLTLPYLKRKLDSLYDGMKAHVDSSRVVQTELIGFCEEVWNMRRLISMHLLLNGEPEEHDTRVTSDSAEEGLVPLPTAEATMLGIHRLCELSPDIHEDRALLPFGIDVSVGSASSVPSTAVETFASGGATAPANEEDTGRRTRWTPEETARFIQLCSEKRTIAFISATLGKTEKQCRIKAKNETAKERKTCTSPALLDEDVTLNASFCTGLPSLNVNESDNFETTGLDPWEGISVLPHSPVNAVDLENTAEWAFSGTESIRMHSQDKRSGPLPPSKAQSVVSPVQVVLPVCAPHVMVIQEATTPPAEVERVPPSASMAVVLYDTHSDASNTEESSARAYWSPADSARFDVLRSQKRSIATIARKLGKTEIQCVYKAKNDKRKRS